MTKDDTPKWDHKRTVRAGTVCAGHLTDAVFNALQRTIWEHHSRDEYATTMLMVLRDLFAAACELAGDHQDEWTTFLQEALTSAGERCRSDNPTGAPGYKRRWQAEADAQYERLLRQEQERKEEDEARARARARRLEDEREQRS